MEDGGLGNSVILIGSFFGGEASGSGVEGIGTMNSTPCSPREIYNIGVRTEAGKFFQNLSSIGIMSFLVTATPLGVPA